jgi:hypothetical protein
VAGAVNGFLGFRFTGGTYHVIMYASIVGIVLVGLVGAVVWIKIVKKRAWRRRMDRQELDEEFTALKLHSDEDDPYGGSLSGHPSPYADSSRGHPSPYLDTDYPNRYAESTSGDISDRNASDPRCEDEYERQRDGSGSSDEENEAGQRNSHTGARYYSTG